MTTCIATKSESEAYTEFCNLPSPLSIGKDDLEEYYVPDALRHQECRPWDRPDTDSDCSDRNILMPDWYRMDAFQICRKLYEITSAMFWGKMPFSFGDLGHFWKFISRLLPKQKRHIRSIDITAPSQTFCYHCYATDFDINTLMDMERLENVNLALHTSWFTDDRHHTAPKELIGEIDIRSTLASQILQLEDMDIERLGVIIFDNEYDFPHNDYLLIGPSFRERFAHRLTLSEKKTLAGFVRRIFKAPKSERQAMFRLQQQIAEAENLLKGLQDAQTVAWRLQRERVWNSMDKTSNGEEPRKEGSDKKECLRND
ncbi:MAG: hypothetical protein Q9203_006962 [Teloschistes exilis]